MGVVFNFVMIQLGPIINIPSWYEAFIHYTPDIETGITSGHTRVLGC
jgi:hypothetical protein